MTLSVGVARTIISPPKGIYLIGYGNRTYGNTGIHDDLTATAMALHDGLHQVVIVACDLLAINEHTVARVQAQTGSNVVICCSHTHSGPITYAGQRSSRRNRAYVSYLVAQIVKVVKDATLNLQAAQLTWAQSEVDVAINRRERKADGHIEIGINPDGPIDRTLSVLQAHSPDGKPIVTLVNFQCHGVVLGPRNRLVSADWIGAMRQIVEQESGAPVMFIQGATGDLNPKHTWGEDDFSAAQEIGSRVAEQVIKALDSPARVQGDAVSFHQEQVWLSLETEAHSSTLPANYRRVLGRKYHLPAFLVDFMLNSRYPWKTMIAARLGFWSVPAVLTHIRVGDLGIIALGMEVFTEIGKQIRQLSNTGHTLFASLSSGCIGYLPTTNEHALGGFEVDIAPYFYRLPGRLQAGSADKVLEAVKNLQV